MIKMGNALNTHPDQNIIFEPDFCGSASYDGGWFDMTKSSIPAAIYQQVRFENPTAMDIHLTRKQRLLQSQNAISPVISGSI